MGLPAADIAALVRAGTVSAVEIVNERRAAAAALPDLNALVDPQWPAALAAAASIDARRRRGDPLGALAGVPITVKDVITVAGLGITAGSRAFAGTIATTTAPAVQRLIDQDAIVLGKTNLPEFALGSTCGNDLFGATANPRYPSRSPGGSSGGEAAAVASGISTIGVGSDYGGSLRWPAQCTGIVSLRPTLGRVDPTGQVPGLGGSMGAGTIAWPSPTSLQGQIQVIGPLAATVADLRLALGVMQRPSPLPPAPPNRALRIAWSDGHGIGPTRSEVAAATMAAAAQLASAGHDVSARPDAFHRCLIPFNHLRAIDPMHDHLQAVRGLENLVSGACMDTFHASMGASPHDLAQAWRAAIEARAAALAIFDEVDAVLVPVAGGPACLPDSSVDIDGRIVRGWELMAHCRAVSLTGTPAVSVPIGTSAEGLPISVQVVAAPWNDGIALEVAAQLETLCA
ncbi:MAG: Amidase [Jatrophihabitantaceae bacterium]|nr:Amidase [Jatrophihabitantaceae bacterium]